MCGFFRLKISLENIVFAVFIQTQSSLMHFTVFSYKYITTKKVQNQSLQIPPFHGFAGCIKIVIVSVCHGERKDSF